MKPTDALRRDYGLYYNGTLMRHDRHGIVAITADDGTLLMRTKKRGKWTPVEPASLTPFWLRPGAYNVRGGAMYIARRARRSSRRSMSPEHYQMMWPRRTNISLDVLWEAALNMDEYTTYDEFKACATQNVAISPEIILTRDEEFRTYVVTRGNKVGKIINDLFIPDGDYGGLPKLTRKLISERGILC
jgi:hypothetical protein